MERKRYFILAPDGGHVPATYAGWADWADRTDLEPVAVSDVDVDGAWLITAFDGVAPRPYSTARITEIGEDQRGEILAEYRTRDAAVAGHEAILRELKRYR